MSKKKKVNTDGTEKKAVTKEVPNSKRLEGDEAKAYLNSLRKDAVEIRQQRFIERFKKTPPAPSITVDKESNTVSATFGIEEMTETCGTAHLAFAQRLINELVIGTKCNEEYNEANANAAIEAVTGIAPKDETEAMLAAQMAVTHHAAMRMLARTLSASILLEGQWASSTAVKLLRTYTMQMDALQRYRGKGQQKMTVEHVHVHAGGQAIVGNVNPAGGGGVQQKSEGQPHAKEIEYQPAETLPPLRCTNAAGEAVPVSGNAKR